jgi:hypothetical protein
MNFQPLLSKLKRTPKEEPKTLLEAYNDIITAYDKNEIPHIDKTTKFYEQLKRLMKDLNENKIGVLPDGKS